MFVGHFAVAFAAKRAAPRLSLGALFAAAQFADLLWPVLVAFGIEQVRIDPGNTAVTPLDFVSYPYSHSLVWLVAWAAIFGAVCQWRSGGRRAFLVVAALVLSHWLLDYLTHRPDMPVYPGGPKFGLGLWNSVAGTLFVELGLYAAGVWIYARATRGRDGVGRWAFIALAAFLLVAYLANLGGVPPSVQAVYIVGIVGGVVLLAWAWWADNHRVPARAVTALAACVVVGLAGSTVAAAQDAEVVLINGKILTVDAAFSTRQALAVRDGRVLAVGTTASIRRLSGPRTQVIDLQGRTVVPGLIDSHLHAIRAALSFSTEVNWIGARSLTEALARIADASRRMKPGAWLIVAGGWNVQQFKENRRPTQAELVAAAPNNPVYVQLGYGWAMLTPPALEALHIATDADLPAGGRLERDPQGKALGSVAGGQGAIIALFDRLPKPTFEQQIEGTRMFFTELNRLGITGVVDPGGNNLSFDDYQALFRVWRDHNLTVRVAYSVCGQTPGAEFDELKNVTLLSPMGVGDDMLHFNGIGERITAAMNNNDRPTEVDKQKYYEIVRWAAGRGLTLTMHWNRDGSVGQLLDIFERVNREVPIAPLRWSIAHLNDASETTLRRMRALGVGWTVQDAMYFGGDQFLQQAGRDAARRAPPVETAKRIGVVVGAGTDAHRVASYNPFTALQWFLDGRTVGGTALRGPEETPSREDALRFYTSGSAWFSFDERRRGSLEPGKLADLAVLTKDYMTIPLEEIGGLESVLTMVGGRVVYAAGPYVKLHATN